ncbi:MAG: PEP-CTERM sorting domain-containing protein [Myxococcota bacterium]|nr:PEP-CTERM sorting domain-containing protein [Myxococcota bacterium]
MTILRVDVGRTGQDVEPGWTGYSTPGLSSAEHTPQVFPDGTWRFDATGLTLATRNYGDIETTPLGDLFEDSALVNTSPADGGFELVLSDLAAGRYVLTTYHHSFALGGASADVSGGAPGGGLDSLGSLTSTTGTDIADVESLTVAFDTSSSVDGYVLRFEPTTAAGSFHFDLAGFELERVAVPEPGVATLLGLGGLGWLAGRRRRRAAGARTPEEPESRF